MHRPYLTVDVFGERPYLGNPLAVVVDADGVTDEQMQRFANWTNLSETTFLLPPTSPAADYRVRIFTTTQELPFAGHPTLGSCHAWLAQGGVPRHSDRIVQECGVGLVEVRRWEAGRLAFAAPPLRRSGPLDRSTLHAAANAMGIAPEDVIDAAWIDNGPGWIGLLLADAAEVLAVTPHDSDLAIGVVGKHRAGRPHAYEVRGFFPADGRTFEDPVTGSLHAAVAQWLIGAGRVTAPYVAAQGTVLGRAGRVHIDRTDDGTIWVGGTVSTCVTGTVRA
ncbi:MAG: hypothetical protein QG597_3280 [Actinomycetota bacterium]|nr:hypothetical protein [Actinomycetota bacterium]